MGCWNSFSLQRIGLYPIAGDLYGQDQAVFVKVHFIDTGDAVVGVGLPQRAAVIDDVPLVFARHPDDRVMAGAGGDGGVLLQDGTDPFKRAQR